jgi:hypothetical protein
MTVLRFVSVFISGSRLVLARPAAGTLAGDDRSLQEQLPTPDAPWLTAFDGTRQALGADRAGPAQRLRELDVARRLGEEELRVLAVARELFLGDAQAPGGARGFEDGGTHLFLQL